MIKSKISMAAVVFALTAIAGAANAYGNIAPFQPVEVSAQNASGYGNLTPFQPAESASPNVSGYGNIAPF